MTRLWKTPELYDHFEDPEDFAHYTNTLLQNVDQLNKNERLPRLRVTKNPVFKYQHRKKNIWDIQTVELYNHYCTDDKLSCSATGSYDNIDIRLHGTYAIVQNVWLGHYGHNLHDNLGRFEYLRQLFNNKIKFILTDFEPGAHKITLQQLRCVNPFYNDNIMYIPPGKVVEINGDLLQVEREDCHWAHESKMYARYLCNGLNTNTPETGEEHIIFCPRSSIGSQHGRINTSADINYIEHQVKHALEINGKRGKFTVFNCEDSTGTRMSIDKQREFFKPATMIIGVHGTAMTNMVWSNRFSNHMLPELQIIEMVGNTSYYNRHTPGAKGCQLNNDMGYWQCMGNHYNVSWKHLFYRTSPGKQDYSEVTFNHENFKRALNDALVQQ